MKQVSLNAERLINQYHHTDRSLFLVLDLMPLVFYTSIITTICTQDSVRFRYEDENIAQGDIG